MVNESRNKWYTEFIDGLIDAKLVFTKILNPNMQIAKGVYRIDTDKNKVCGYIRIHKGMVLGNICLNHRALMFHYRIGDKDVGDFPDDEAMKQACERMKYEILRYLIMYKNDKNEDNEEKVMIALINYGEYYISGCENIKDFLIEYVKHIGDMDVRVFEILVESDKMTTKELIEYINNHCCSDEKIDEIYEVGKKIY